MSPAGPVAPADGSFSAIAARVDAAIGAIEGLDPAARDAARELKEALELFHRSGLARMVTALRADTRGRELLYDLVDEPDVRALLLLHGLIRLPLPVRVEQAIARLRAALEEQGVVLEAGEVSSAEVVVRLSSEHAGCSTTSPDLSREIEASLRAALPDVAEIRLVPHEPQPQPQVIPLHALRTKSTPWTSGPPLAAIVQGRPYRLDARDTSVVLFRVGDRVHAFRNECAHQGLPLDGGLVDVEAGTVTCPWHGFRFDCASGECLTAPHVQLEPVPVRVDDGVVSVQVP